MTENEAIEDLEQSIIDIQKTGGTYPEEETLPIAIKALKEIQEYRAIGTVEECRAAMERLKSKTPDIWGDGCDKKGNIIYDMYSCPSCGKNYEIEGEQYNHCPECGQAIDLSALEEAGGESDE